MSLADYTKGTDFRPPSGCPSSTSSSSTPGSRLRGAGETLLAPRFVHRDGFEVAFDASKREDVE